MKKTHGMTNSTEYRSWCMMKSRCTNKNFHKYKNYGERGITICDRWINSFENFYYDMGDKPLKRYSIERHDNNGNYTYSNCYWADAKTQARNRRIQYNCPYRISGVNKQGLGYQVSMNSKYVGYSTDFFDACCIRKSAENKSYDEQLNESMVK